MQLKFRRLPATFAVCRLAPDAQLPALSSTAVFISITRTAEELSIVCPVDQAPQNAKCESPWTCFKLEGPFAFSLTGVLAAFLNPLAERGIPIFAISTFDTDYVLVEEGMRTLRLRLCRLLATTWFPDWPADGLGELVKDQTLASPRNGNTSFKLGVLGSK